MITEEKGLVPPRRRQVEIENEKLDNDAGKGKISVAEPRLGQVREYGLDMPKAEGTFFLTARTSCQHQPKWIFRG